jgi:hypothetical protein
MEGWMNLGSFCQKTCDNNDKLGCVCLKIFWNLLLLLLFIYYYYYYYCVSLKLN